MKKLLRLVIFLTSLIFIVIILPSKTAKAQYRKSNGEYHYIDGHTFSTNEVNTDNYEYDWGLINWGTSNPSGNYHNLYNTPLRSIDDSRRYYRNFTLLPMVYEGWEKAHAIWLNKNDLWNSNVVCKFNSDWQNMNGGGMDGGWAQSDYHEWTYDGVRDCNNPKSAGGNDGVLWQVDGANQYMRTTIQYYRRAKPWANFQGTGLYDGGTTYSNGNTLWSKGDNSNIHLSTSAYAEYGIPGGAIDWALNNDAGIKLVKQVIKVKNAKTNAHILRTSWTNREFITTGSQDLFFDSSHTVSVHTNMEDFNNLGPHNNLNGTGVATYFTPLDGFDYSIDQVLYGDKYSWESNGGINSYSAQSHDTGQNRERLNKFSNGSTGGPDKPNYDVLKIDQKAPICSDASVSEYNESTNSVKVSIEGMKDFRGDLIPANSEEWKIIEDKATYQQKYNDIISKDPLAGCGNAKVITELYSEKSDKDSGNKDRAYSEKETPVNSENPGEISFDVNFVATKGSDALKKEFNETHGIFYLYIYLSDNLDNKRCIGRIRVVRKPSIWLYEARVKAPYTEKTGETINAKDYLSKRNTTCGYDEWEYPMSFNGKLPQLRKWYQRADSSSKLDSLDKYQKIQAYLSTKVDAEYVNTTYYGLKDINDYTNNAMFEYWCQSYGQIKAKGENWFNQTDATNWVIGDRVDGTSYDRLDMFDIDASSEYYTEGTVSKTKRYTTAAATLNTGYKGTDDPDFKFLAQGNMYCYGAYYMYDKYEGTQSPSNPKLTMTPVTDSNMEYFVETGFLISIDGVAPNPIGFETNTDLSDENKGVFNLKGVEDKRDNANDPEGCGFDEDSDKSYLKIYPIEDESNSYEIKFTDLASKLNKSGDSYSFLYDSVESFKNVYGNYVFELHLCDNVNNDNQELINKYLKDLDTDNPIIEPSDPDEPEPPIIIISRTPPGGDATVTLETWKYNKPNTNEYWVNAKETFKVKTTYKLKGKGTVDKTTLTFINTKNKDEYARWWCWAPGSKPADMGDCDRVATDPIIFNYSAELSGGQSLTMDDSTNKLIGTYILKAKGKYHGYKMTLNTATENNKVQYTHNNKTYYDPDNELKICGTATEKDGKILCVDAKAPVIKASTATSTKLNIGVYDVNSGLSEFAIYLPSENEGLSKDTYQSLLSGDTCDLNENVLQTFDGRFVDSYTENRFSHKKDDYVFFRAVDNVGNVSYGYEYQPVPHGDGKIYVNDKEVTKNNINTNGVILNGKRYMKVQAEANLTGFVSPPEHEYHLEEIRDSKGNIIGYDNVASEEYTKEYLAWSQTVKTSTGQSLINDNSYYPIFTFYGINNDSLGEIVPESGYSKIDSKNYYIAKINKIEKTDKTVYISDTKNTTDKPDLSISNNTSTGVDTLSWKAIDDVMTTYNFGIQGRFDYQDSLDTICEVNKDKSNNALRFASGFKNYNVKLFYQGATKNESTDGELKLDYNTKSGKYDDDKNLSYTIPSDWKTGWYKAKAIMYDYNGNPSGEAVLYFFHVRLELFVDLSVTAVKDVAWETETYPIRYGVLGDTDDWDEEKWHLTLGDYQQIGDWKVSSKFPLGKNYKYNGNPIKKGYALNYTIRDSGYFGNEPTTSDNLLTEDKLSSLEVQYVFVGDSGQTLKGYKKNKSGVEKTLESYDVANHTNFTSQKLTSEQLEKFNNSRSSNELVYIKHYVPADCYFKTSGSGTVYNGNVTVHVKFKGKRYQSVIYSKEKYPLYTFTQDETAIDDLKPDKQR